MKLEMNRAWGQAMALIGAKKDVVFVVAGVLFFLPYLIFLMAMPQVAAMSDPATAEAAFEQMGAFYADAWWAMLLISILQGIGMLGLLALLTDHRRPTVGEALKIGASKILSYLAAYILLAIAVGMVAMLLIGGAAATHRVVRPGGAFLTYQFSAVARDLTARHFGRVETGFAWWNIPPCLLAWGWQTD